MIVYGTYHWGRRKTAYRNDACLGCRTYVVSEQYRMFDVGHLFWIPLLPLGFRKRWYCSRCGKDPHARLDTGRWTYVLGGIVTSLTAVMFWVMPAVPPDTSTTWACRIGMPALAAFLIFRAAAYKQPIALQQALESVPPYSDDLCIYCRQELQGGQTKFCRGCNIERMP